MSSETTPRSEAASSNETITGNTEVNVNSKTEAVTSKPGVIGSSKKGTVNDETGNEGTDVKSIESSSGKISGGVLVYVIVALVVILVGYVVYVNKAKVI